MYRMAVSTSANSAPRPSKNGSVKAQSVTSRMTNGTPSTGAISAHMANIREQNGPGAAYVQPNVTERRSSGYASAYSWAIMPPMETPIRWKSVNPSESTTALASSASSLLVYGPAGLELAPMPLLSMRSTR